jgi:alkylation response protein AidB-like acyl-CoA dehydrogenase
MNMSANSSSQTHLIGGNFLLSETDPTLVYTPEDLSHEARMIGDIALNFMEKAVLPETEALEKQEPGLAVKLFKQAGELGLHGLEIAEEFGGTGLGKRDSLGVSGQFNRLGGFGVTCGAHGCIGTMPLVYFGNKQQKDKYLAKLASGEWMASYCLSEESSGSDALGMKTKAQLSPDGKSFILNGTKMWISNAAWSDLFTVFAKVGGEHVTAFLVERTFPGVSFGKEEHKLGLKSSSTRRVVLENVHVPVENVLGGVGKGAYIAFNILNFGRFSLATGAVGGAAEMIRVATRYANERTQFGRPIASFGLIQQKLADMAARTFATESAVYRTAGMIDDVMATGELLDMTDPGFPRGLEEFAIECSILKVACSEVLDDAADETLQIHGGYGFSEEYPPARASRDARINRIFEGTNEINRLFIPTTLLRRAERSRFPLMQIARDAHKPIDSDPRANHADKLIAAEGLLCNAKKLVLSMLALAVQKFGNKIVEEQEVLAAVADIAIEIYLGESALLRTKKGHPQSDHESVMSMLTLIFVSDSVKRIEHRASTACAALFTGDELDARLDAVHRLCSWNPPNVIDLRRRIAGTLSTAGDLASMLNESLNMAKS